MEFLKFLIILVVTLAIGIGLPVIIYLMVRGGAGLRDLEVFSRAFNAPRTINSQQKDLDELSRRVAELRAARQVDDREDEEA